MNYHKQSMAPFVFYADFECIGYRRKNAVYKLIENLLEEQK